MSTLIKTQKRKFGPVFYKEAGDKETIVATVRYDDECGNKHNTFAITGEIRHRGVLVAAGCLHEEIAAHFPELAPLIKWHLVSSDGPMHYIANSLYWLGIGRYSELNLGRFRSTAVWGACPALDSTIDLEQLPNMAPEHIREMLTDRLGQLLASFRTDVESLGFAY